MAHPDGTVYLELDGREFELKYTFSDFADADEILDRDYFSEFERGEFRPSTLRALFYVGARPSKHFRSVKQAASFLSMQNLTEVADAIGEALQAAVGPEDEDADDSGEA